MVVAEKAIAYSSVLFFKEINSLSVSDAVIRKGPVES